MDRGRRHEPSPGPRQQSAHDDRSPAERIAADVFIELLRKSRVRPYDIATQCQTRSITRHAAAGPRHAILRSFELAPPFWPLTVDQNGALLRGYGMNRAGTPIRYTQTPYPITSRTDDLTVRRVRFGPGCHELMRRASSTNPLFICQRLTHPQAVQVLTEYLIDAVISLSEGGGPLVIAGNVAAPSRLRPFSAEINE